MDEEINKLVSQYNKDGYVVVKAYSENEYNKIEYFALDWIKSVIQPLANKKIEDKDVANYHLWFENENIAHSRIFINDNRVIEPDKTITDLFQNKLLLQFISKIIGGKFTIYRDPGVGWLCYRLIRPGYNDGYHLCKKSWGVANRVVSIWLPIIGFTSQETLQVLPGSHLREYKKIKKKESKFVEPQVDEKIEPSLLKRLNLERGELIVYHPDILHSENVVESPITRFNLEFRFNPE